MALCATKSVDLLEGSGPKEEAAHPDGPSTRLAPVTWAFPYDFRTTFSLKFWRNWTVSVCNIAISMTVCFVIIIIDILIRLKLLWAFSIQTSKLVRVSSDSLDS